MDQQERIDRLYKLWERTALFDDNYDDISELYADALNRKPVYVLITQANIGYHRFCGYCNNEVKFHAKFCDQCGRELLGNAK